jgi:predicted TIM-barrel fold metal-dependent hydrolase
MSIFDEPKIDCHCHILDPARFPYGPDVAYRPSTQEVGTLAQYQQVMAAYGVRHALLVAPNSGYGLDNRCLLDAIAQSQGRFKGMAMVRNEASLDELRALKAAGVIGVAFNPTLLGTAFYAGTAPLLKRLAELDMFVNVQVEQLLDLLPLLANSPARVLIDHCGRPSPTAGINQAGFQALLRLAETGRVAVKLSGFQKFSSQAPPYGDSLVFVRALIDAFSLDACLWASDWPFLKAPERLDYGPLLMQLERLLPSAAQRQQLLWSTPKRWLGFDMENTI